MIPDIYIVSREYVWGKLRRLMRYLFGREQGHAHGDPAPLASAEDKSFTDA